jgi:hypothetical protein
MVADTDAVVIEEVLLNSQEWVWVWLAVVVILGLVVFGHCQWLIKIIEFL